MERSLKPFIFLIILLNFFSLGCDFRIKGHEIFLDEKQPMLKIRFGKETTFINGKEHVFYEDTSPVKEVYFLDRRPYCQWLVVQENAMWHVMHVMKDWPSIERVKDKFQRESLLRDIADRQPEIMIE